MARTGDSGDLMLTWARIAAHPVALEDRSPISSSTAVISSTTISVLDARAVREAVDTAPAGPAGVARCLVSCGRDRQAHAGQDLIRVGAAHAAARGVGQRPVLGDPGRG